MQAGDTVQFYLTDYGTRTGRYIRTIERGKDFGLIEIETTMGVPRRKVRVRPEDVKLIRTLGN